MKNLRLFLFCLACAVCLGVDAATSFVVESLKYTTTGTSTVSVAKVDASTPSGSVVVPETVTYNGTTYTVTSVASSGFSDNIKMTSIELPSTITKIGDEAFKYCDGLTSVVIPDNVTSIGEESFYFCDNLESVTLGSGLQTIGRSAFANSAKIKEIVIPASVTSIDYDAFYSCDALTSITVEEGNTAYKSIDGVLFTADGATLVRYPSSRSGDSYTVPSSVTTIYGSSFSGSLYLKTVTLPEGLTRINNYAFANCEALESISVPNSVTYVGEECFSFCKALKTVNIGTGVSTMGYGVFKGTTALECINVDEGNATYQDIDGVLFSKDGTILYAYPNQKGKSYSVPEGVTTIYSYAFSYCDNVESVTLSSTVTKLNTYAFMYCTNLKEVNNTDALTRISGFCFQGCTSLESLWLPSSIQSLGSYAFLRCDALERVFMEEPLSISFTRLTDSKPILYVPVGTKETFAATSGYNQFEDIIEIGLADLRGDTLVIGVGREKSLVLSCQVTAYAAPTTMAFDLTLPEGLSLGDVAPTMGEGNETDSLTVTLNKDGTYHFAYQAPEGDTLVVNGGRLITIPLKAADDATPDTVEALLTNVSFTLTYFKQQQDTVVCCIVIVEKDEVTLNENDTALPEDLSASDVKVVRSIAGGVWNTLCLPFDMTGEQLREAFGADVQLARMTSANVTAQNPDGTPTVIEVDFASMNVGEGLKANFPCIIKTSADVESFTAERVSIEPAEQPMAPGGSDTMVGTYVAETVVPAEALYLSDNAFWYSVGKTKMKGFRAYFVLSKVIEAYSKAGSEAKVSLSVDGVPTALDLMIERGGKGAQGEVYDLQGRSVGKDALKKGVYVKRGKKFRIN